MGHSNNRFELNHNNNFVYNYGYISMSNNKGSNYSQISKEFEQWGDEIDRLVKAKQKARQEYKNKQALKPIDTIIQELENRGLGNIIDKDLMRKENVIPRFRIECETPDGRPIAFRPSHTDNYTFSIPKRLYVTGYYKRELP